MFDDARVSSCDVRNLVRSAQSVFCMYLYGTLVVAGHCARHDVRTLLDVRHCVVRDDWHAGTLVDVRHCVRRDDLQPNQARVPVRVVA